MYVDKQKLYQSLSDYYYAYHHAKKHNTPQPRIPDYVGECILLIAENFAKKPSYSQYPFVEDMIGDAVENCVMYIHNFNPEKSNQPFSYITQIVYYAFLRRIMKEKKYLATKFKAILNANLTSVASGQQDHDTLNYGIEIQQGEAVEEYISRFLDEFEKDKT